MLLGIGLLLVLYPPGGTTGGDWEIVSPGMELKYVAVNGEKRQASQGIAVLRIAAHDFGGHRVEALKATDEAIRQLEVCLKFDKD